MNEYKLKEQICEIGRRALRQGLRGRQRRQHHRPPQRPEILCTPTMVSKGFMKPEDICKVDYDGKQLAGTRKRTSEVLLHLAVYKQRPDVNGRRPLPSAARHRVRRRPRADPQVRPARGRGLPRRGADRRLRDARRPEVRRHRSSPYVKDCNTIMLANHGTVTFGPDLEKAYWNTEIIDAYCKILILAKQLGRVNYFDEQQDARTAGAEEAARLRRRALPRRELRAVRRQQLRRVATATSCPSRTPSAATSLLRRSRRATARAAGGAGHGRAGADDHRAGDGGAEWRGRVLTHRRVD